jgi:hypothetical protein
MLEGADVKSKGLLRKRFRHNAQRPSGWASAAFSLLLLEALRR